MEDKNKEQKIIDEILTIVILAIFGCLCIYTSYTSTYPLLSLFLGIVSIGKATFNTIILAFKKASEKE